MKMQCGILSQQLKIASLRARTFTGGRTKGALSNKERQPRQLGRLVPGARQTAIFILFTSEKKSVNLHEEEQMRFGFSYTRPGLPTSTHQHPRAQTWTPYNYTGSNYSTPKKIPDHN